MTYLYNFKGFSLTSWNKAYGYSACDYCMTPLETAEQNVRRLTFDDNIILPYPDLDEVAHVQQNFVTCCECGTKYCSSECLSIAEKLYHKVMCEANLPGGPIDELNEAWKVKKLILKS